MVKVAIKSEELTPFGGISDFLDTYILIFPCEGLEFVTVFLMKFAL